MVFQEYALFPWMTVRENVAFGLQIRGDPEARAKADTLLEKLALRGFGDRYPKDLSGGMRQRVALARALALDAPMLLMDEPFGALDAQTRSLMQSELYAIWQRTPKTVIFVTHDVQEAVRLAQRVLVMSARPGRIKANVNIQLDRADPHIYRSPAFAEKVDEIWDLVRDEALKAQ